jgi:GTP-binding protein
MSFSVAIVGRPNVGKSTLFNRLVGKKLALVDDAAGVTRDRREGRARLGDLDFTVIDTAGLQEGDAKSLESRMRAQTEAAIAQADAIFFVIDSRVGLTPADSYFAQLLRRADKPVILVANKAEGRAGEAGAYESFGLGLGDPVPISAEHGEGLGGLYETLIATLPDLTAPPVEVQAERVEQPEFGEEEDGSELDVTKPLRFAVVGRPNAGKSTLINRILGEERLLTGPEAGVTRDSIGIDFSWHGRSMKIFDTAGLRKRANIQDKLEKLAAADAIRAVKFADVVVVLVDATVPFERQDLSIADLVEREGRALVIALNKWDLVAEPGKTLKRLREEADELLPQAEGSPVVPVCGLTGAGLEKLMDAVIHTHEIWNRRIATGKLNRWLAATIERTPPPAVSGRRIKIRYVTQPKARPPTFVLFGNQLDALPTSYERYLVRGLRETFDLRGVPLRFAKRQSKNPFTAKNGRNGGR